MLVLIDGDVIVYRAGFASESTEEHLVVQVEDNAPEQHIFRRTGEDTPAKKKKAWLAETEEHRGHVEILDEEKVIIPEKIENALYTVKAIIREILRSVAKEYHCDVFDLQQRVLLSGADNFRIKLSTVKGYKANRKDVRKPYHYQAIRDYLTNQWDADVIVGREADDELAIASLAHDGASVICTIDKDLDQVPGNHYDFVRRVHYQVDADEGALLFYKQVLSGDATDNIAGCHRVGTVRAAAVIDNVYLEHGVDHARIWDAILATYDHTITQYGEKCAYYELAMEEGVEAVAIEMARLVKMQEFEGQLWFPYHTPDGLLEDTDDE